MYLRLIPDELVEVFLDGNKFALNMMKYFFKKKLSFFCYCHLKLTEAFLLTSVYSKVG